MSFEMKRNAFKDEKVGVTKDMLDILAECQTAWIQRVCYAH